MYLKYFSFEPRLKTYHTIIGKYDVIDKFTFSKVTFHRLKNIKLSLTCSKLVSNTLSHLLIIEFLTQKSYNIKKSNKLKYKNFNVTLRGDWLLLYLELLINTIFILNKEKNLVNDSCFSVDLIVSSSFNSEISLNLFNNFNKKASLISTLNFRGSSLYLKLFLSYYFIP